MVVRTTNGVYFNVDVFPRVGRREKGAYNNSVHRLLNERSLSAMADCFCLFISQISSSLSLKEDVTDFIYGYTICGYKSNGYIMSIIGYEISLVVQP